MFDEASDRDREHQDEVWRVKNAAYSIISVAVMAVDWFVRRPEDSLWRIPTFVVLVAAAVTQARVPEEFDRSTRIQFGLVPAIGAVLLLGGLYVESLSIWLLGLGLLVLAYLVPRWYSEPGNRSPDQPDC